MPFQSRNSSVDPIWVPKRTERMQMSHSPFFGPVFQYIWLHVTAPTKLSSNNASSKFLRCWNIKIFYIYFRGRKAKKSKIWEILNSFFRKHFSNLLSKSRFDAERTNVKNHCKFWPFPSHTNRGYRPRSANLKAEPFLQIPPPLEFFRGEEWRSQDKGSLRLVLK